jgi:hypothetical protein
MDTEDQIRYEELHKYDKDSLVHRVMELEDIITTNDEQLQHIQAENTAMQEEIRSWNRRAKGRPPSWTGEGIGDLRHYFDKYYSKTKEDVLVQLMKAEALLFESGIIRSAQ